MDTVDVITMKMEGRDFAAYPQTYTGEHGIVDMSIGYTFFSAPDSSNNIDSQKSRQLW